MFIPSLANRPSNEGPSCSIDHNVLNHLVILFRCPLLFIYIGVDMIVPSVPAALPGFEVFSLRLDEHLVADPLPLTFKLLFFHDIIQQGNLLRAPSLINFLRTKDGDEFVSKKLLIFQWKKFSNY